MRFIWANGLPKMPSRRSQRCVRAAAARCILARTALAKLRCRCAKGLVPAGDATGVIDQAKMSPLPEIAQLLDADWVVLSACNTAAGASDKPGARLCRARREASLRRRPRAVGSHREGQFRGNNKADNGGICRKPQKPTQSSAVPKLCAVP